ncbi:MAG: Matrixin [Thermoleophilaceae bacterium]|nr:Matrixin [Thermoleophilaceae bacterium]
MRRAAAISVVLALAVCAAPAGASDPGIVSKLGIAVCWHATDYRYGAQLARAERLWNQVAGRTRIMNETEGCIPNWNIEVDLRVHKDDIQATTYPGVEGYKGEIIFFKAELDHWPECRKWIALHEFGHALGLEHDPKYRTIMHASCPADYKKPVSRPTLRDITQFRAVWSYFPLGVESDVDLASAE